MSFHRIHSAMQRSSTNHHSTSPIPESLTQTLPAPSRAPAALTQRRSAIPTRNTRNTTAELATSSPSGDTVRGQSNQAGPALTTFRNMRGAGVSGGFFVNTTGPVSFHNADYDGSVAVGTNSHVQPTRDPNSIMTGPSQNAEYDIYYNHLLVKGRGTPLWEPGPQMTFPNEYRKNGVSIGDVGILYRTGDFAFLFNIFLPADHVINMGRVPNGFIPLDKSKVEKTIKRSVVYDRGSCLASSSLRRTGSSDFAFQTTGGEGAVLVMPDGALSEDLRHYKLVEKYIAENAQSWYEFVESDDCGMPTENGDIRVVVGMDKVASWGMATFENVNAEEPLQFELKDDGRGSHARTYKWERIVAGRAGPPEEEIRDLLQGPDTSPLRNQCVFVRTLNVSVAGKVRDELAVYEVRASCFRDCFSAESSRHQARPGQRNVNAQSSQLGQPVSHPSKLLNKYLLEKCPNAKVIITNDLDWMSVITENDTPTPDFEDICARVLASHIICENNGVVTLKKKQDVGRAESDDETYVTGRLFLKAPDDPPRYTPMEPQVGESESLLYLRASGFNNVNSSGDDKGGNSVDYTGNTIDKGLPGEFFCPPSIRGQKERMATTPVAEGAISANEGEISKGFLQPISLSASGESIQETYSRDTPSTIAEKVMRWFRDKYKGRGSPIGEAKRTQCISASSSTINPCGPSTAPGLSESGVSDMLSQVVQPLAFLIIPAWAVVGYSTAMRRSHSSIIAAEQQDDLTIQETLPTHIPFGPSRDVSWKSLWFKDTRRSMVFHLSMDIFMLLHFVDIVQRLVAVVNLTWAVDGEVEAGNFTAAQGFLKMFGAMGVALSTLEIALCTFIGVWLMGSSPTSGVVGSIDMLVSVVFPAINERSKPNFMDAQPYWCWIPTTSIIPPEYFLWFAMFFSLFLWLSLYLSARCNATFSLTPSTVTFPRNHDQRRGSPVMLAYPLMYCLCVIPLSVARWMTIVQEAIYGMSQMPLEVRLGLEVIHIPTVLLNVLLLDPGFGWFGRWMFISPTRPLIISRDERPPDNHKENRQGNLPLSL